jgi:threonine/homoserine/homoserine lactone efflux protein
MNAERREKLQSVGRIRPLQRILSNPMIALSTYFAFVAAAVFIIATPGPSVLFVVARSIQLGMRGGLLSVLGVAIGASLHAVAVALGVAELLKRVPESFLVIKSLGCFYLIYLGLRTLLAKPARDQLDGDGSASGRRILTQGFLVEFLNPKTALFFVAFLPQFANPTGEHLSLQLLLLGVTFVVIGLISDGVYAAAAGKLSGWLKKSERFRRAEKYFSGCTYCGLGIGGLFYRVPENA